MRWDGVGVRSAFFICREGWVWNDVVWGVSWGMVRGMCVVQ